MKLREFPQLGRIIVGLFRLLIGRPSGIEMSSREFLAQLFHEAVKAADPARGIAAHLPAKPKGRVIVVAAGKAAHSMISAFENLWDGPIEGIGVTRYGYGGPTQKIELLEAAHPVPDQAGQAAAARILQAVQGLSEDDLVIALISGGGSALLVSPPPGLSLADEMALNEALLASGMAIHDMNCVRKHFSLIKGGRLAKSAFPARVVSFIVSDIPGDDPALVASGPTIADARGRITAIELLEKYSVKLPVIMQEWINSAAADAPKPDEMCFARNEVHLIASAGLSLAAAAEYARKSGIDVEILSDAIEGEARDAGRDHARIALMREKPCLLLSGGETTVTLAQKPGRGGRNSEFLLAFAIDIAGQNHIHALAADSDGIDGSEDNAGAFADGQSVARMAAQGIDAANMLACHDAWSAFHAVGDLFVTGPTRTNVNDFRAIWIGEKG